MNKRKEMKQEEGIFRIYKGETKFCCVTKAQLFANPWSIESSSLHYFFYELEFSICSKPRERLRWNESIKKIKIKRAGAGKGVSRVYGFLPPIF